MSKTRNKSMEAWWQEVCQAGAVWQHSGDPRAPHVCLRSGKHSNGFVDTLLYLSNVRNLSHASWELVSLIRNCLGEFLNVDWVFGSPMAGIPIATVVADILDAKHIGFTEKTGPGRDLTCRFDLEPGSNVIMIEEMTTTGSTPQRGINSIRERNPDVEILPAVGAFLTRGGIAPEGLKDARLVPVVDTCELGIEFKEWNVPDGEKCPLCEAGSLAVTNTKHVWTDMLESMHNPDHVFVRIPEYT